MSNNIRMLVINDFDDGTVSLTSGTAVPSLPATNLQKYNNSRIFRCASTAAVLKGNFEDIRLISAFVAWRHNITAAGTIRLRLFANINQGGDVMYDSGEFPALKQTVFGDWDWRIQPVVSSAFDSWETKYSQLWFSGVFAASWEITLSDPVNPAGYLDVTRIYMGRHFSPRVNFNYGGTFGFDTASEQIRIEDGGLFSSGGEVWRKNSFTLAYLDSADRAAFIKALRDVKKDDDWFVSLYPEQSSQLEIENSYACKFTTLPPVTAANYNNWSAPVSIEEC